MSVLIDALKVVTSVALLGVIGVTFIYIGVVIGYFVGGVLVLLPWVSGVLSAVIPTAIIPNVTAWLAVGVLIVGTPRFLRKVNLTKRSDD